MPKEIKSELQRLGRTIVWWRVELVLTCCLAGIVTGLCLFGFVDVFWHCSRGGRYATSLVLVAMVGVAAWLMQRAVSRRLSPLGVAATLELAFPELDNRLINYIQFSDDGDSNAFKAAYVKRGEPGWRDLNIKRMRNQRRQTRSWLALAVAFVFLLSPGAFLGRAWAVALWRVANPFTDTAPVTLTHILEVAPGDTTLLQGEQLVLTCRVQGQSGHKVWVDIDPSDADKTTYALGKIAGADPEDFAHRIPQVTTRIRYRFRAGDATAGKWHEVKTVPPPAFTGIRLTVTPPAYTQRQADHYDALADEISVPEGSRVDLDIACNTELKSVSVAAANTNVVPARPAGENSWRASLTVLSGTTLTIKAKDTQAIEIEEQVNYTFIADNPPIIEVLEPTGRTVLPPGEKPRISFRVHDDYGLADAVLAQIDGGSSSKKARARQSWKLENPLEFDQAWKDDTRPQPGRALVYRIIARDNCPFDRKIAKSASIVFNTATHLQAEKARNKLEQQAFTGLDRAVELQTLNIDQTRALKETIEQAQPAQWSETAERQQEIRTIVKSLLDNPINPLGTLAVSAKKLYVDEMAEVITVLAGVPSLKGRARNLRASKGLSIEERILRHLTAAKQAVGESKVARRVSGIGAMLSTLVREETATLKQTQAYAKSKAEVSETLVDTQDNLATDLTQLIEACTREAGEVAGSDPTYAATLQDIASKALKERIRDDMMLASESLDENKPAAALPHEESALKKLKALDAALQLVELQEDAQRNEAMLEALQQANEKLDKIKDLHQKMKDAMDAVKAQRDASDDSKEDDMMEEEFQEMVANTMEAMMEIPTDLNVFMELNVANDLVEDVFAIFQEVAAQTEEDKNADPDAVKDVGVTQKEAAAGLGMTVEECLENMEEASERMDSMEMWLGEQVDKDKVTVENFDQEQMPEAGMALAELASEAEDIIGDLMDEQDDTAEAADDGATNVGVPDMEAGWGITEGRNSSFAAQGKSGNETPDHKEQDGRSNVGRQGMAVGETAASSGTIGEGDKNIEERRTQEPTSSGHVDLDGEADTRATGGGKLASGKADGLGMNGGTERMDSNEEGSSEGMAALMAKQADALYAKASTKNVRADGLKSAAHHLRQSADAIAKGNIDEMKEHKRMAVAALQQAKANLAAGPSGQFKLDGAPTLIDDLVEGGPDSAPPKYRDLVADYYKSLNDAM